MVVSGINPFLSRVRRLSGVGRGVLIALSLFSLTSCSSKPLVINPSQEGVVVRYGWFNSPADAQALAQENCAKYGRNAVLQGSSTAGSVFASYYCVKPGTSEP